MGTKEKGGDTGKDKMFSVCLSVSDKHKELLAIHVDKQITQYITALGGLVAA